MDPIVSERIDLARTDTHLKRPHCAIPEHRLSISREDFKKLSVQDAMRFVVEALKDSDVARPVWTEESRTMERGYSTIYKLLDSQTTRALALKLVAPDSGSRGKMEVFVEAEEPALQAQLPHVIPALLVLRDASDANNGKGDLLGFVKVWHPGEPCGDLLLGMPENDPRRAAIKEAVVGCFADWLTADFLFVDLDLNNLLVVSTGTPEHPKYEIDLVDTGALVKKGDDVVPLLDSLADHKTLSEGFDELLALQVEAATVHP